MTDLVQAIRDVLDELLGQVGADAVGNAWFFPTGQPTNPSVGVLEHKEGGLAGTVPRVVAIVGPGMTFQGLAGSFLTDVSIGDDGWMTQ